jgi:hypothetical protein
MRSQPGRFPGQGAQLIRHNFAPFVAEMLRTSGECGGVGRVALGLLENARGGMSVWLAFSATCGRGLSSSAKEAVEEDEEDGGADGDVELVSLEGESGDAEDDAEDWRGDEEDESELDDSGWFEMGDGVEES